MGKKSKTRLKCIESEVELLKSEVLKLSARVAALSEVKSYGQGHIPLELNRVYEEIWNPFGPYDGRDSSGNFNPHTAKVISNQ